MSEGPYGHSINPKPHWGRWIEKRYCECRYAGSDEFHWTCCGNIYVNSTCERINSDLKHTGQWVNRSQCNCCYFGSDELHWTCCNNIIFKSICDKNKMKKNGYW
jgi:hypothetical protein